MGAAAVPSASSPENMAGILIVLLILLIAAFSPTPGRSSRPCYARLFPMTAVSFVCESDYLKNKAFAPEIPVRSLDQTLHRAARS